MKKLIIMSSFLIALSMVFMVSCKKVEKGFLSENLRYIADTLLLRQGQALTTNGLVLDNTTQPLKVRLIDVRNKETGKREETFFKSYKVGVFKSVFNPLTDTTLSLFTSKIDTVLRSPISVLETSGQFIFTAATANVPVGKYLVDLEVENINGKKTYMGITTIDLKAPVLYDFTTVPYFVALKKGTETGIRFAFDDQWINAATGKGTTVDLNIQRVANSPNQVILKVYDKDGLLLPGKALQKRPSGASFLNTLGSFSYKTTVTDTAVIYDYFPTTRFPDTYYDDKTNNILAYYRIYNEYISSIDTANTKTWFPPVNTPYGTWKKEPVDVNVRFSSRLFKPGKYIFNLKLKLTKK